jgi:hypothetical protein
MVPEKNAWLVEDFFEPIADGVVAPLETCWQFAPECKIEKLSERSFKLIRTEGAVLLITVGESWKEINLFTPKKYEHFHSAPEDLNGLCSPSFRTLQRGPRLVLSGPLNTKLSIHIQGE